MIDSDTIKNSKENIKIITQNEILSSEKVYLVYIQINLQILKKKLLLKLDYNFNN